MGNGNKPNGSFASPDKVDLNFGSIMGNNQANGITSPKNEGEGSEEEEENRG